MIGAIILLGAMVGAVVLLVWLMRNSRGIGIGIICLSLGLVLVAWFIYNLFFPTNAFQNSYKSPLQLIFPAVLIWYGWKRLMDEGPGIDQQNIDFNSPELQEAVAKAKEATPWFLEQIQKNIDGAYIKFPFKTDTNVVEHVWAYVHSYANGQFNVSMVNTPHTQKGKFESRMTVLGGDIEDWQIMYPDGRIKGAFSYIGAFKYLEKKQVRLNRALSKQKSQLVDF